MYGSLRTASLHISSVLRWSGIYSRVSGSSSDDDVRWEHTHTPHVGTLRASHWLGLANAVAGVTLPTSSNAVNI